jgi:hypothetical protein
MYEMEEKNANLVSDLIFGNNRKVTNNEKATDLQINDNTTLCYINRQ